ncbi:MAG: PAS domain S-box protein [Thiobacillus sp.]|nr:PAS domain S-box protein [Thiobacillus sp.]
MLPTRRFCLPRFVQYALAGMCLVLAALAYGRSSLDAHAAQTASPPKLSLSTGDQAWLAAHPVIRLGIDTGYAPYSFVDEHGRFRGVARDYVAYLESVLGIRFEIVSNLDWPQLMDAVRERRVDAVATVVKLPEREPFLEFSAVYIPTPPVVMTRDTAPPIRSLEALTDLDVMLAKGYSSSTSVMTAFPQLKPRYVATPLAGLEAVSSGLADAYIGVIGVNTYLASRHGLSNLSVNAGFDMKPYGQRFGVRKDWPQLARILDEALAAMPAKQKNDISQAWVPVHAGMLHRLAPPSLLDRLAPWLEGLLAIAVLMYLVMIFWNRQLKRELERRQGELRDSTRRLRAAERIAHVGNWRFNLAAATIQWSDEVYRIFGIAPQSREITYEWLISQIHPDDRAAHDEFQDRMLNSRPGDVLPELRYRLATSVGTRRTVSVRARIDYDGAGKACTLFGTIQDISEQIRNEESIAALNRLYRVLSGINEAIARRRDPQVLFDEACRIAVETGRFRMAWVGRIDPEDRRVTPLAHAGAVKGYLDTIHISTGDDAHALGPTGTAVRTGERAICNDIAEDRHMAPWREAALARGYRSSAAFPIQVNGETRAVFNLYSDRTGFFDTDEMRLLDELAEDIGFALEFIETDSARETLNRRMIDLLENMSDGFVSLDRNWCYRYVNRRAGEMFGRVPADLIGKHIWSEFPEGVGQPFHRAYERAMQGGAMIRLEEFYPPWDQWYENRIYPTQDGISIFFTDISERKKSENELKRIHSVLNALVTGSTDIIFVKDTQGRYLLANEALAEMLERPVDDILGVEDAALFPPESAGRFRGDDQRTMDEGVTRCYEETVETPRGRHSYLTTKGPLVIDGEICGVFGIARDITARKQTELDLAESESRLRLFIEHAPAALAMFDRDMRYLAVSRRWLTAYHLERSDILGESHYVVFPDVPERWKAIHQRGLAGELVRSSQDRFERADGSVQWLSWEIRPWFAADSSVGGIVIFSEDITERIRVEQSLRESEARFGATFEQAAVGIALVSPEGHWLRVNRKLCDIVGYSETELLGLTFQDITHPDDLTADLGHVQKMLANEIDTYSMEKRYLRKDGSQVWINLTVALVWTADRQPAYFVSVIEDIDARKAAESALHESEAHYRLLFERNPAPMLVYERGSLKMLAVNEAFVQHYGYSQDEAMALRLTDLYPVEEKQAVSNVADQLHGLAYVGEWHHLKRDGSLITIEARSHDLDFEGHRARVAVFTDITVRKQAELAIQQSEARYRSLVELAPFPAVLTRIRDGILVYGNHRAETQYGISRDQGIGLPAENFYQDAARRQQFIEMLQRDGKVDDFEVGMLTADRTPFWALVSASIVEFGNEPAIFTAINDISARKQTELALREQEAFFRLIAENIGDLVAVLDLQGRCLYYSPSYASLFGSLETLKGTDSFSEVHPDDRARVRAVFDETIRTGKGRRINFRFVLQDGSEREIESQGGVIRDAAGKVERVVMVSRDVTERTKMENEIRRFNTELEERVRQRTADLAAANQELETFTYTVSHDLKAPLRGIDGYSRLLLEDYQFELDAAGVQLVANVRKGVTQMSQLIEDLLNYSRMERRSLNPQSLDLVSLVEATLASMQPDIEAHGMRVDLDLKDLAARGDAEGLTIVIRNLVDNALKFTRDSKPPSLSITGLATEKSVILKFTDNGIGFDMQFHHRIFEIFQRLQRAEDYVGTGIGLAIVQKAMQRMGGRVWADSAPGQGATFYLELPR